MMRTERPGNQIFIGIIAAATWLLPLQLYANALPDPSIDAVPDVREDKPLVIAKKRNFVIVPIPLSNPTLGTGLVLGGAYFYKQTPEQKKVQPASVTGAAGMYTSNESFAYGIGHQSYWNEDTWRFSGALGEADIKLDILAPGPGVDVEWRVQGEFFTAKLLRKMWGDWYGGIHARYFNNTQTFSVNINGEGFGTDVDSKTVGAGLNLDFDSRDLPTNPSTGRIFTAAALFNDEALGSTDTYQGYDASFKSYHRLAEELVLAWEIRGCYKSGTVPLWDACKVHLRGFPITEYLSKTSASTQVEGRWQPFKRFGFVAFVGGGLSDRSYADEFDDDLIPSYGIGARWMVMKEQRINMRIDYARSDGQDAWYLAVGEAF